MVSTKSTFFSKKYGTAETLGTTGFVGCRNQKTKLFTIVANESCTQLYITIGIKKSFGTIGTWLERRT